MSDADQERVLTALLGMQRQSWEQGVAGHALLDLGRHDLLRVMARDAIVRQAPTGTLADIHDDSVVNGAANGEAVAWLADTTGDAGHAAALGRQLTWLERDAPRAADGTLFHLMRNRRVWVDTVYMVVPLLVLAGHVEAAATQMAGHRQRLFDPSARLYAHQWDEDSASLVRGQFWGTGNGWVVAGIARALHHARRDPRTTAAWCADLAAHAKDVIDACLPLRTTSGQFHDVVDDPATFEETNLAQMLAYAMLTGVADGWLPARYAEAGRSLMRTARKHIDRDGFVTPVCGAPHFDRPGTSAEAQAFFLLATAAERLLEQT
jgi:unsaturated rhamnogalacturonyl hydrolase